MNDISVVLAVIDGVRPKRPSKQTRRAISDEMWHLTEQCWSQTISERPTMASAVKSMMNFSIAHWTSAKVLVEDLDSSTTESMLFDIFSTVGPVTRYFTSTQLLLIY